MLKRVQSHRQRSKMFQANRRISQQIPDPIIMKFNKKNKIPIHFQGKTYDAYVLLFNCEEVGIYIPKLSNDILRLQNQIFPKSLTIRILPDMETTSSFFGITNKSPGYFIQIEIDETPKEIQLYCTEGIKTNGVETCYPDEPPCDDAFFESECCEDPTRLLIDLGAQGSHELSTTKNGCQTDWKTFNLFQKTLKWTVNIGNNGDGVGCGCNASFYSVPLKEGEDYRDAQSDDPLPEFDFMEANQSAWQTTIHNDPGGIFIGTGGDVERLDDDQYKFQSEDGTTENTYGKGNSFIINTEKEFMATLKQTFEGDSLIGISVELQQDGKKIVASFPSETKNDLKTFGKNFYNEEEGRKPVLFWSLWDSDSMEWLDSPPCKKLEQGSGKYLFQNLSIFS